MAKRKIFNPVSEKRGYKCKKCKAYIPYFHGDCFMYYDFPRICNCGGEMTLIEI